MRLSFNPCTNEPRIQDPRIKDPQEKCPFWEWEKATFTAFPHFRKVTSGARNKNLRPVLISALWRGNVVSNLLTFSYWKVVFSLFLILHRAFSHFMYLTFCQFRKRKMVQSWFQKLFWNQDCDVVGNLVVENEIFNFYLFVCFLVCLYLTFCQFCKGKWSNHGFKNWSESGCGIFKLKLLVFSLHSNACHSHKSALKKSDQNEITWTVR